MAIRIIQKNGSDNVTAEDDAKVNYVLFGTCIFGGIGKELALTSGSDSLTIGRGMACLGGRLISVDAEEKLASSSQTVYFIVDLREEGKEAAYLSDSFDDIEGIEVGSSVFLESGKIYEIPLYTNGQPALDTRKPGEASKARALSPSGYLGKTSLGDLFVIDDMGRITDFKQVQHCAYSDVASSLRIGDMNVNVASGLSMNFGGTTNVRRLVEKQVATVLSIPAQKTSSSADIFSDSSSKKISIDLETFSSFDNAFYVMVKSDEECGFSDAALSILEGGTVTFFTGLEIAFKKADNLATRYYRWNKDSSPEALGHVYVYLVGTVK